MKGSNTFFGLPLPQVTVDASNGNDGSGSRYGPAFRTIAAGLAAALAGDTIFIFPGTYDENALILRDGVNFYFAPGSRIVATDDTAPIFDDDTAQVSCVLDGFGYFECNGGVLKVQNAGSVVTFNCIEAKTTVADVAVGVIHVVNCGRVMVTAKRMNAVGCSALYVQNGGYIYAKSDQFIGSISGRCATIEAGNVFIESESSGGSNGLVISGGTVNFSGKEVVCISEAVNISGGTLYYNGQYVYSGTAFNVSAGYVNASVQKVLSDNYGLLQTGGTFQFTGGDIESSDIAVRFISGICKISNCRIVGMSCVSIGDAQTIYLSACVLIVGSGDMMISDLAGDAVLIGCAANAAKDASITVIGAALVVNAAFS